MSVLVKGMKMPECCASCQFAEEESSEWFTCYAQDCSLPMANRYAIDSNCPLAELNEVDREPGEWIEDGDFIDCSACHKEKWSRGEPFESLVKGFRYCPNCGQKMNVKRRFEG